MLWSKIIGQGKVKEKLKKSIAEGRISHAQLFSGKEGSGALPLAIAYAGEILCSEKNQNCQAKINSLQHPDLHFSFPVATTDKVKDKPTSQNFMKEWREFIIENPYQNVFDWFQFLEIEKKQGAINVHEAEEIIKTLSLNSYEGGYKITIIWLPELMNNSAANKLLKILEEPPQKTVFLLVSEREDLLLPTIISRCQLIQINPPENEEIASFLVNEKQIPESEAKRIAHNSQGNFREALRMIQNLDNAFESFFVSWVRNAFLAAKNPSALKNLVQWSSEISAWSRERQKQFLIYCSEVFRQALLENYGANSLIFMETKSDGFKLENFAPFVHGANIEDILAELNEASFHVERNANSKIVFLDLSIKLTRYLHKKA